MMIELGKIRTEISKNMAIVSNSNNEFNNGAIYAYKKILSYLNEFEVEKKRELKESMPEPKFKAEMKTVLTEINNK